MTPESSHRSASLPVNDTARRGPRVAIALGAVALLAAVALLSRGSSQEGGKPAASQAAAPQPSSTGPGKAGHTAPGQSVQAESRPKQFNTTVCWEDLERFNDAVTLETFREWAGPLLAVKDPLVREYLMGRLGELIGDDEGRASEVLGWAREASPAEFKLLMGGLRNSKALPKMASQLTELGLDEKLDLGRRAGFLDELQRMPRLEPAALDKLTTFAQDASSGEAGWVTTRAIGRVMQEDFKKSGNFKPYLDKLLTIGTQSADEQVRYLSLEMGMTADAPLDTQAMERLGKLLATEGSEDVRMMAAHELSMSEDKSQALDLYGKNFEIEKDLCVRWALFRFAARTAGKDALPVMANMAMTDPRFQGIYQEFEKLYASGIVDFGRIWFSLSTDDPFGCLDRHEE
jgi:hypothetical protein